MTENNIIEISKTEFMANVGKRVIVKGNCTACSTSQGGKGNKDKKVTHNKIENGVTFNRNAKSRISSRLPLYAKLHERDKKCNLAFITLTFPCAHNIELYSAQIHDNALCWCVQRFFKLATKQGIVNDFCWFAERHLGDEKHTSQMAEYDKKHFLWLHFHCFVWLNGFQPIQKINDLWLSVLSRHNLQFETQNENGDNYQPVDAIWLQRGGKSHLAKLLNYVRKYATKADETTIYYCRCWGCSRGISSVKENKEISIEDFKDLEPFISKAWRIEVGEKVIDENTKIPAHTIYVAYFDKSLLRPRNADKFYKHFNIN